jgi:DNA topoisomerase-1
MSGAAILFQDWKQAEETLSLLASSELIVLDKRIQLVEEAPPLPFATLDLLEDATLRFGWNSETVMAGAQNLFELGFITYPRTDSTSTDPHAQEQARNVARRIYGADSIPRKPRIQTYEQGAHEAIRPTNPERLPDQSGLPIDAQELYRLIWERFIASQMKPAKFYAIEVDVNVKS